MILLAAVIVAATAAGAVADRRRPASTDRIARRLMDAILWLLLPVVAFFNMAALELTVEVGAGIGFAYVGLAATMGLAWLVGARVLRLPRPATGALIVAAGLANTGYLGLPFNAVTLGFDALPQAVAYDVLVSSTALVTVGFSVGAAFGTAATEPRGRVRAFFTRNPALWATAAGLLAPEALAPGWAVDATRVLVIATVPIGFFAVGAALSGESGTAAKRPGGTAPEAGGGRPGRTAPEAAGERRGGRAPVTVATRSMRLAPLDRPVVAATALKLLVPPAVVAGLSALLVAVPEPYLLQAAMPTGVNTLVIAHAYGLDRRIAAGSIAWTTAIVVVVGVVVALL